MSQRKPARRPPSRPPAKRGRAITPPATPAVGAPRPFLTPNASPFRRAVERRSAIVVLFLRGLPKAVPALLVLGILAGGLTLTGPLGAICFTLSALVLIWLVYLSWPALTVPGRAIRVAVIGLVGVLAGARFIG